MGLLDKFNEVKIDNEKRFSAEDMEACKEMQMLYEDATVNIKKAVEILEGVRERTTNSKFRITNDAISRIHHLNDSLEHLNGNLVTEIITYFNKKYGTAISSYDFNYENAIIHYETVLDYIVEQLNGKTFEEKVVEELKEKTRQRYSGYESRINKYVQVKGKKLILKDFFYWDVSFYGRYHLSWGRNGKDLSQDLLNSLSHFIDGNKFRNYAFETIQEKLCDYHNDSWNFEPFTFNEDYPIQSLKYYKNGRLDITFNDAKQAEEFKNEYMI